MDDLAPPRVALYTFGLLKAPMGSPVLDDFAAAAPTIYGTAATADGFIANADDARPDLEGRVVIGEVYGDWGRYAVPRFYKGSTDPDAMSMIATLTLWRDFAAAHAFVYGGPHREALRRRAEWFVKHDFPGYVLWWVPAGRVPTWGEGAAKLEALTDKGPMPDAFSFASHFDPDGRPLGHVHGDAAPAR